jgi:hypothetical protein
MNLNNPKYKIGQYLCVRSYFLPDQKTLILLVYDIFESEEIFRYRMKIIYNRNDKQTIGQFVSFNVDNIDADEKFIIDIDYNLNQ